MKTKKATSIKADTSTRSPKEPKRAPATQARLEKARVVVKAKMAARYASKPATMKPAAKPFKDVLVQKAKGAAATGKPEKGGELLPPAPLPKAPPAPASIALVKENDGKKNKRYVSKTDPDSKYHLRDRSDAEKPVAIVRDVCKRNPKMARKDVINLCIAQGVNKNTAATQYSLWKAAEKAATLKDDEGGEE